MGLKWNDNTGSLLGEQHGGICFRWNEQASQRIRLGIGNIKLNDHHNIIFVTQISYWIFKIMRFYIHTISTFENIYFVFCYMKRKKCVYLWGCVMFSCVERWHKNLCVEPHLHRECHIDTVLASITARPC